VHDIEQRLLGGSRSSEKSPLAAFQQASGHRKRAVLAIGEDIVMSNQAASELLSPSDVALLRVLAEEPLHRDEYVLKLLLESGAAGTAPCHRWTRRSAGCPGRRSAGFWRRPPRGRLGRALGQRRGRHHAVCGQRVQVAEDAPLVGGQVRGAG
jgi:hypothetical protein